VEFDEKDDDVAVPDFDYAPKGKFTAAFWFRARDNSGSGCQYMLSHGRVGAHHNLNVYFMEDGYVRSQGVLRTSLADEDDKEGEGPEALGQLDVPRGLADGKWHHYALVVDAGGSRVYIDGEKRAESKNGGGAFNPDGKLFIGCRQNRARARFYGGDLDDVRVYSRALSANEVRDLARAKAAPVPVPVPAPAKLKINIEKYNGKAVARRPKVIPAGAPDSFRKGVVASTGVRDPWTWDEVPPQLAGCARILGPWQGKKAEREDTYVVRVNGPCAVYALLCEEGGGKRRKWMDQSWQSTSLRARGNGVAWRAWKKRMTAAGTVTVGDDNVTYRTVFLVFAPIGPKPEPPAGGGPVARWTLDSLAGGTAADATIGGHDGVVVGGPRAVTGVIAGAAKFDEKDDRIEIHDFDYAPKGEFTAAFWFRVRKVRGYSYEYMFSHGGFQKPNSVHVHFCEWGVAGKGGVLRTRLNDASNPSAGDSAVLDVKRGLDDDKWHHYALAVGRFGSRVYIDGEKKVDSRNGGGPFNPPGKLVLGARSDLDKDRFFGGALDDVRIYSRALSADEVRGLAKSAPASPAGPASGAFIEKDGLVVMEAEHSTGQEAGEGNTAASKWIEDKAQKGFAGECAVAVLPDKGVAALETGAGPRLDYAVKFSKTGTYYAWIRMLGPNGFSDSLHAGFDGKPLAPKTPTIAAGGRWNWESLPGGTKLDMKVDKPGKHTFNIWMHEDGVYVDRIILTTDPDFKPEREGPAESAREGGGQSLRPSPPGSPAEAGSVYLCDLKPARVLKRKQDTVEFDKRVEAHGKTYEKCLVMKPAQYGTTVVGYELDGKYSLLLTGKAYLGTGAQGSFSFVVLDGATQLFKSHASSENSKIDVRGVKKLFIRSHTTRALPADARAVWLSPRLIPVEPRK
jgi:hypothetical protein